MTSYANSAVGDQMTLLYDIRSGPSLFTSIPFKHTRAHPQNTNNTVSIHCAPEISEIDCIGRIESIWPKFVRGGKYFRMFSYS